jgi:hypothetical protein
MIRTMIRTSLLFFAIGLNVSHIVAQTSNTNKQLQNLNRNVEFTFLGQRVTPTTYRPAMRLLPTMKRTPMLNHSSIPVTPMAASQVSGSGTVGRLSKWTGLTTSSSVLGNSTIFEDKFGMVGIGTDTPTSRLTVAGMIHALSGGYKFPDGTVQTTSASGSLFTVVHDATLSGNGTAVSPLTISIPLFLQGLSGLDALVTIANHAPGGEGLQSSGGDGDTTNGGVGLVGAGGNSNSGNAGRGLSALGGTSNMGVSGDGLSAQGGFGGFAGTGVNAKGGGSNIGTGGEGVTAYGGDSDSGWGGEGVVAFGGHSNTGKGGTGLFAAGGTGGLGSGNAGFFNGHVEVTGILSKGGGSFKIDHPLDPENKYLYHSFVESPDMKNIYDGNITTDANGEAVVTLPDWFEALNRDFRYQLTVIGTFAQAIVGEKIKGNQFRIKTSVPNTEVSWQVTGIRRDAFANKHRIPVEEKKTEKEQGYYLHPEAFNQPDELGIEWMRHPELMQQRKAVRQQTKPKLQ